MALESSITSSVIKYLNSLPGCRAEKLKGSSSASGRADINACYQGRCMRIEMKTPDNKNAASKKQNHNLDKWYKAGAVVMVAYSKLSVMTLIKYLQTEQAGEWYFREDNGCISWVKIPAWPKINITL